MGNLQDDLMVRRLQNLAEAQGWILVGLDKRGTDIQVTFSIAKTPPSPAQQLPPVVEPA